MNSYEKLLMELLRRLNENTERIAAALENMSPPGERDREADKMISVVGSSHSTAEDRKALSDAIRDILHRQVLDDSLQQLFCPTEHTPNPDGEPLPGEPDQQSDTPPHL